MLQAHLASPFFWARLFSYSPTDPAQQFPHAPHGTKKAYDPGLIPYTLTRSNGRMSW